MPPTRFLWMCLLLTLCVTTVEAQIARFVFCNYLSHVIRFFGNQNSVHVYLFSKEVSTSVEMSLLFSYILKTLF